MKNYQKVLSNCFSLRNILIGQNNSQEGCGCLCCLFFFISNYVENPHQNENKLFKTETQLCTQAQWKIRQK